MAKILIIDDEPFIRLLIQECLEEFTEQGVEILFADNGKDGLELIREEHPDLVFLDVMLPALSGYDVCTAVKSEAILQDVRVVMLTAKGQDEERAQGSRVGADVYMTKPFRPDEVVEKASWALGLKVA